MTKDLDDYREEAIERLKGHVKDIVRDLRYLTIIIVPHIRYCSVISDLLAQEIIESGLAAEDDLKHLKTYIEAEHFRIDIAPVSIFAVKGRSFDAIYLPPLDALSPSQQRELGEMDIYIRINTDPEMANVIHGDVSAKAVWY